jgi:hypothetical protein
MTKHQALGSLGRPAVFAFDDLNVGPTDANRDRFNQDRAVALIGVGDLLVSGAVRLLWFDSDGFHWSISFGCWSCFMLRARASPLHLIPLLPPDRHDAKHANQQHGKDRTKDCEHSCIQGKPLP